VELDLNALQHLPGPAPQTACSGGLEPESCETTCSVTGQYGTYTN
jgi:hypothetical protein